MSDVDKDALERYKSGHEVVSDTGEASELEPGRQIVHRPIVHVTDPAEVDEIRRRALGRDLRPQTPVKPIEGEGVGDTHSSGMQILANFPGVGPVGLSRLNESDQRAVTRNIAEAIHHQFTVAQMIVWITQPTKGRKRGRFTVHFEEGCPALRRAKHAKMTVLQRQPAGLPYPEERECKICRSIADEREQAEMLAKLMLPPPVEWDPVELTDMGEPRWLVLHPTEMLEISRAQLVVKTAYERERLPDPASIRIDIEPLIDRIYVLDLRKLTELPQSPPAMPRGD